MISGIDVVTADIAAADRTVTLTSDFVDQSDSDTVTVTLLNDANDGNDITLNAAVAAGMTVNIAAITDATGWALGNSDNRVTLLTTADSNSDGDTADETGVTVTLGSGDNVITGGGSIDTITLGSGTNTVTGGAGADIIRSTLANFDGFNVIDGGEGTDNLTIVSDGDADVIVDNYFTGVTTVETLTLAAGGNDTVTLGSRASAAGIATIVLSTANDSVTLDSGFASDITLDGSNNGTYTLDVSSGTGAVTITGGSAVETNTLGSGAATVTSGGADDITTMGAGTLTYTGGAGNETIIIANGQLTSADTIAGAGGTDVLQTTGAVTLVDADFTNLTSVETVEASTNDGALTITVSTLATAAGLATIDSGDGADTITATGFTGTLTINGAAGDDTITGGTGVDTITAGGGDDTIVITDADPDTNVVDTVVFGTVAASGTDTITGFESGTDVIKFLDADTTDGTSGADAVIGTVNVNPTLVAGATFDIGALQSFATADVVEVLGFNADNANLSASDDGTELLKGLGVSGSAATSITVAAASQTGFLVAYDNGNAYIYHLAETDGGGDVIVNDISVVAVVNNIAVGGLAAGDLYIV